MLLPDLDELLTLRGPAQGLSLHAHRPALARLQGGHRSAQRGRGLEFEEVRLYAPGDDARSIDWRVTARRGKPHTKLFREERERPVWIVADLHPGLFFGSRRQLKSGLILRASALLGWVATLGGDRLGAIVGGNATEPLILPPRARQAGILPFLEALIERQPQAPGVPDAQALPAMVERLRGVAQPGSLIIILSDFAAPGAALENALASLAGRCDLRLLWATDPLERGGLPAGDYRVGLPGRLWRLDGARSREPWQRAWAAREQQLGDLAARLNLPLNKLDTADDMAETLPPLLREPQWAA